VTREKLREIYPKGKVMSKRISRILVERPGQP
jgi:hypothetical protein